MEELLRNLENMVGSVRKGAAKILGIGISAVVAIASAVGIYKFFKHKK